MNDRVETTRLYRLIRDHLAYDEVLTCGGVRVYYVPPLDLHHACYVIEWETMSHNGRGWKATRARRKVLASNLETTQRQVAAYLCAVHRVRADGCWQTAAVLPMRAGPIPPLVA